MTEESWDDSIVQVELQYMLLKNTWYYLRLGHFFDARITGVHGDAADYLLRKFMEYVEDPKPMEMRLPQEMSGDITWTVEPLSKDGKIVRMYIEANYHRYKEQATFNTNIKHFLISVCMEFKKNIELMKCDDFEETRSFGCWGYAIDELQDTVLKRFD